LALTAWLGPFISGLPLKTKNTYHIKTKFLSVHLSLYAGRHLLGVQSVTSLTSNLFTVVTRYSSSIKSHLGGTTEFQPRVFLAYMY